ncbi:response regulator [Chloroflexi bacterium TSY]|nr:response regulator [Chloroflexi bacterium TSY]
MVANLGQQETSTYNAPAPEFPNQLIPNILIVDDEEKLGRFICMVLKKAGYQSVACRSVAEARTLIGTNTWHLVLTDIVMPRENGFELAYWISQNYPRLPVIAMTAHSTEAIVHQANQLGVAAILHKPFTLEGLRKLLSETTQLYVNSHRS